MHSATFLQQLSNIRGYKYFEHSKQHTLVIVLQYCYLGVALHGSTTQTSYTIKYPT